MCWIYYLTAVFLTLALMIHFHCTFTLVTKIMTSPNSALWANSKYMWRNYLSVTIRHSISVFFPILFSSLTNHASNNGRGLNIVLINSKRLEIKYFVTFDVYMDNSIVMDTWINSSVTLDDIVLVYTYDEASRMLAESSKKLFYNYGE